MAVVIIEGAITPEQVVLASEEYGEYVKVVVDIEKGFLAAGGIQQSGSNGPGDKK